VDLQQAHYAVTREHLLAPRSLDVRDRHGAFWAGQPVDQPLVGIFRQTMLPMARFLERIGEGEIHPQDIRPADWLDLYEETFQRTGLIWGDLVWWASPLNGFPWVEAIAGCTIHASRQTGSAWAAPHPALGDGMTPGALSRVVEGLAYDPANPWQQKLLECTQALVQQACGRFPIAPGIMRGASDLAAAMLGQEQFCLAVYDAPEFLAALAEKAGRLWRQIVGAQMECIPRFGGGYVNAGLWSPAPCPVYQEDASVLISPASFSRYFLDDGRRVWAAYPNSILHLHSGGLQVVPSLLKAACPPVIEINLDPAGPGLDGLLPILSSIQRQTRLEILGTQAEVERCLVELRPERTAYLVLEESMV
jgi:hypothetical protein